MNGGLAVTHADITAALHERYGRMVGQLTQEVAELSAVNAKAAERIGELEAQVDRLLDAAGASDPGEPGVRPGR